MAAVELNSTPVRTCDHHLFVLYLFIMLRSGELKPSIDEGSCYYYPAACHCMLLTSALPIGPEQLLLRGAILKNTRWIFGKKFCKKMKMTNYCLSSSGFNGLTELFHAQRFSHIICLSAYLPIYLSICLSMYLFYLSVCISIYLYGHLSVYLSIKISICHFHFLAKSPPTQRHILTLF